MGLLYPIRLRAGILQGLLKVATLATKVAATVSKPALPKARRAAGYHQSPKGDFADVGAVLTAALWTLRKPWEISVQPLTLTLRDGLS